MPSIEKDAQDLAAWYRKNRRDLPWRKNRDPYRIWISEVMLQQTTVAAVVPFYERFLKRFPALKELAQANLEDVYEMWAGLGYYTRAKNLHLSAQEIFRRGGFPKTFEELFELPGFGPYTSRAVASLAFDQAVGVIDGNVIRGLSRKYGMKLEFWRPSEREKYQVVADQMARAEAPADLNQALMEHGATICTPQNPACLICPWTKSCIARKEGSIAELPLKKPRKEKQIWIWTATVVERAGKVLLVPNSYAPFLKGHWILPGKVERKTSPPKKFAFRGTVTHHDIFVNVEKTNKQNSTGDSSEKKWVSKSSLKKEVPVSLIRKAIEYEV